jgi:serine/threonine-protein kinase RsbW
MSAVEALCRELLDDARACGFSDDGVFAIHLSLEEALGNAVKHGNRNDDTRSVKVDCTVSLEKFEISITDEGSGFDAVSLPDCRSPENLYKCGGRGVLLMQSYMDLVEFNCPGNCVHMIKYRSKGESDEAGND